MVGGKTVLVIGAGLIGAYVTREMASRGYDVVATVCTPREVAPFEKRARVELFEIKDNTRAYKSYDGRITLQTGFDVLGEGAMRALLTETQKRGDVSAVVNSVNLGTIFGAKSAGGNLRDGEVFEFCYKTNRALTEAAERQGSVIKHVTVGTTGTGGIGIEKLKISHDSKTPVPVREKARCANEILSTFRDFRQSNPHVDYIGIVPACAVVDTEVFNEPVPLYGEFRELSKSTNGNLPLVSSRTKEVVGDFEAAHFIFGEDGPHTAYDAQQLVMFMGLTHAERVAQIAADELEGTGTNNHNVLTGGATIPPMDNHLIRSMEVKFRKSGRAFPTLSPIGPFDIPLLSVAFDLLDKAGYKTLSDAMSFSPGRAEAEILRYLQNDENYVDRAVSLGIRFRLNGSDIGGRFVRGEIVGGEVSKADDEKIPMISLEGVNAKCKEFGRELHSRGMLSTFMEQYGDDPLLSDINGYLAAHPIARTMPKRRHLLA